MQNAPMEHSAMLLTIIMLLFIIKVFVLSIFEWPIKTCFTVLGRVSTELGMAWYSEV